MQRLSNSKKTMNSEEKSLNSQEKQDKTNVFYEEIFDFNKSLEFFEKFSVKNSISLKKKANLTLEIDLNTTENPEKQFSPKCDSTTKTIKPLYICYNNTKFASPVMMDNNSGKKRVFDELFEEKTAFPYASFEKINPIDDFCDDF